MEPFVEIEAIAARIGRLLAARGESVAVSESSSGGLVSAALLSVPGASAFYLGGAVVYTPKARQALLDIPAEAMKNIRSASEPWAALMAATIRDSHGATWGLAETGAAGPTGNRYGDPAGHVCFAVDGPVRRQVTLRTGSAERSANMRAFAAAALGLFEDVLEGRA